MNLFLNAIKEVRENTENNVGLCAGLRASEGIEEIHFNLWHDWYTDVAEFLEHCFLTWPEFSGDIFYPVPCLGMNPYEAYKTLHKYKGEYGAARMRLLDHIEHTYRTKYGFDKE